MSQQPPGPDAPDPADGDRREPDDSPQRRLVESVAAYEVDPPPPARVPAGEGGADERDGGPAEPA